MKRSHRQKTQMKEELWFTLLTLAQKPEKV